MNISLGDYLPVLGDPKAAEKFLIYVFNCGLEDANLINIKEIVKNYLPAYQKAHPGEKINVNMFEIQLTKCKFVRENSKNGLYKLNIPMILQQRIENINELDKRLQNEIKAAPTQKKNVPQIFGSQDTILTFQFNMRQRASRLTGIICFKCSVSFRSYTDLWKHLSSHLNMATVHWKETPESASRKFIVSFKPHDKFLRISIKNLMGNDYKIIRVLIIDREKRYFQQDVSKEPQKDPFFIDVSDRYLDNAYEFPCILIYEVFKMKYVELHNFPRMRSSNSVPTLKIEKELPDYLPGPTAKDLHEGKIEVDLLLDFMKNGKILTCENVCDILKILTEMEDWATSKMYKIFNRSSALITFSRVDAEDGYEYVVELRGQQEKISQILKIGDQIVLRERLFEVFGTITEINKEQIFFVVETKLGSNKYRITFMPQRLKIKYQHQAINYLRDHHSLRERLFPLCSQPDLTQLASCRLTFFNSTLTGNQEQCEAVQNIVDNTNKKIPFILFGPPGTGKTTVIVEAILQLVRADKKKRILVTAGSNAACDEIALRLKKHFDENELLNAAMLRIYAQSCNKKTLNKNLINVSNMEGRKQFYPALENIYQYSVIIATLTVVGRLVHAEISSKHFTHVFIDECGSTMEPESLLGMCGILSPAANLILAGDPKQLGPIVNCSKAAMYGLDRSLLERLLDQDCYKVDSNTMKYNKSIQTRLRMNYRSHPAILSLSNQLYYDNQLQAMANSKISNKALGWPLLCNKTFPVLFKTVDGEMQQIKNSTSYFNQDEINIVMAYVKDIMFYGILNEKVSQEEIGIISPYKLQSKFLRNELDKRGWDRITTGSVETFQGQEKSIIIVSTVRSRIKSPGFLNNPKRLNVLLTRAQSLLIIIGNANTLFRIGDWEHLIDYCVLNKAFLRDASLFVSSELETLSISKKSSCDASAENDATKKLEENCDVEQEEKQEEEKKEDGQNENGDDENEIFLNFTMLFNEMK